MSKAGEGDHIPTGRIRRAAPLVKVTVQSTGDRVIDALRRSSPDPSTTAKRAERYVEVLGRSKGALMKTAQMLSVLPISSEGSPVNQAAFRAAMARLQSNAPPMAPELAAEVLRAELGMPPNEAFAEFSPNPIAAASIGQVHIARHHDGRQLAVKIQYPGVAHAIRTDLRNTELVAVFMQLLRSVVPGLSRSDPKALAAEISERITEELDYEVEATNQSYFADVYRGHPFIRIPEVVPEVSTSRVLTQELAEGLNWNEAIEADQELRNLWGEVIWRFGHGSLRRLGVFNADPHPGNYIFHLDGTVTFLDFGCVKRFTPSQVTEVKAIYRAGAEGDWEGLCQVLNEGGTFDLKHGLTVDELVQHFRTRNELFITGPQPFTVTPEMLNGMLEQELSLKGVDGKFVRTVKNAHAWMFYMRLELGIYGVLAGLRASAEGLAIVRELDGGAPPLTDLGKQEESFWLAREATA